MRITKKIESEIKFVMNDYWESYLKGNLDRWANYLVNDYRNIGSTEVEIWNSKKEIYDYSASVADQMVGFTELRNKKTEIIPYDPYVMVHEYLDIYIKVDEKWTFYSKLRLSSLIQKIDNAWKILHQHGSYPDSKVTDGEFFAFDTLKSENLKLQEAVKNRTIELEAKNRDLEIEASLERVRAVAMGMNKSEELLKICEISFEELQKLGFENLRNAVIHVLNDEQKYFMDYDFSDFTGGQIGKVEYGLHPIVDEYLKKIRSAKDAFFEVVIADDMLEDWNEFRRKSGQMHDQRLDNAKALYYYLFSIGIGDIGISTFKPISDSQIKILKRFRNVFDLAYRRYNDITLAESQAREAQIEAALERVRAKSMAMHKSDELLEAGELLYRELSKLGIEKLVCGYVLIDEDEKIGWNYGVNPGDGTIKPLPTGIPQTETKVMQSITASWKKREPRLVIQLDPEETIKHQTFIAERCINFPMSKEQLLAISPERLIIHTFNFKHGYLLIVGDILLANEQQEMVVRFAKVFEQTYTRFLDLQKAEAQAREAQIEAALEKARNQSMMMQHSEEVKELSKIFHEQLIALNIPSEFSYIWLPNEQNNDHMFWATWSETKKGKSITQSKSVVYPLDKSEPYTAACFEAWGSDLPVHITKIQPDETEQFFDTWKDLLKGAKKLKAKNFPEGIYYAESYMRYGCFGINIRRTLDEGEQKILYRFTVEFERAYTRFLDLQKAEAQAREAQIEAALERVRAASMAMHNSEDLSNVASVLFEQMKNLGGDLFAFGIVLCDKHENMVEQWHSLGNEGMMPPFFVPINLDYIHQYRYDQWRAGVELFSIEIPKEYIARHFELMFELPSVEAAMKNVTAKDIKVEVPKWEIDYGASFKHGYLLVSSLKPFEEDYIFPRFAKVFEQAYTRFLDLQKAEAQAREAQIEAALEKVRSRSLGMHKSEEIKDVVVTVMEKMNELNIEMNGGVSLATFVPDSNDLVHWYVNPDHVDGPVTMHLPYFENVLFYDFVEARKSGKEILPVVYSYEQKNEYFEYAFEHSDFRIIHEELKKWILEQPYFGYSVAIQKHSAIFFNDYSGKLFTEEENEVLIRFAKVFDQAYIRFLDLQKAEAQAREAKIETALEKVRARTMGMQHSDELPEAANLLFFEVQELGIPAWSAGYNVLAEDKKSSDCWMSSEGAIQEPAILYFTEEPSFIEWYDFLQSEETFFVQELGGEALVDHYNYLRSIPDIGEVLKKLDDAGIELPTYQINHLCKFTHGFLLFITYELVPESHDIFKRFAKVFQQTYTRFLDLQKAEAQAREAQIEAALERVRSRSMGMQKSEELKEVIQVVYEQFVQLDINIEHTGFIMDYKAREDMYIWLADKHEVPFQVTIPYFDSPHWNSFNDAKENGKDLFVNHLSFEDKNKFYQDLFEYIPGVPEETKEYYFNCPGLAISTVLLDNVGLYIENFSGTPYSDEENKLLMRFGKVFQQTYTRFLDLQKAEAQAKEAQIEAALERVRARAMGMHKSEEVGDVSDLLFSELNKLNLDVLGCSVVVIDEDKDKMELWRARSNVAIKPFERTSFSKAMNLLKKYMPDWFPLFIKALGKRKNYLVDELLDDRRSQFINAIAEQYKYSDSEKTQLLNNAPEKITTHYIFFKLGYLALLGENKLSDENLFIARRFVEVFEFSYTRFLDIKKAEQQAREAQIEAALERVRSRSMAMRKSEELADLSFELVKQVHALGIETWFCAFNIYDDDLRGSLEWGSNAQGTYEEYRTPRKGIFLRYYEAGQKGETLLINEIGKDECPRHYDYLCTLPGVGEQLLQMRDAGIPFPASQIDHVAFFKYGYIIFITFEPAPEAHNIFKRFAKVFEQSYTRFLDLQKAEEQVRLTEQQASLDRVRAEIASMRTTEDLEKITPLIWRELTTLGIPFIRCGIFIFDEPNSVAHAYLSTPLGKSLAALHVQISDTWLENAVDHWRMGKTYHEIWDREQFIAWTQRMMDQGFVENKEQFQAGKEAPERLSLQLFPFKQGMLYVGSKLQLSELEIEIAQKLAADFGVAYSRYEDFQKLEAANERKSIELEEARQLQLAMLPKVLPQLPDLDIAVYMQTATEVGGDYYDFNVGEDGELTAVIGDATGHGMKAGTIVTITKSLFNSLASGKNILDTFTRISKVIKDMKFRQLAMCLMMLKIHKNKLMISSAAMPPALIFRKKKNLVEEIELKGMPLGAMENFPYEIRETSINNGDAILLMSDGMPELHNGTNEMYGYDRIMNEFNIVGNKAPEEIIDHFKKSAAEWINGSDPDDDVTFVVIKVK